MTAKDELDRVLDSWFEVDAEAAPPPEPLGRILETTRRLRPRPMLVAGVGSHWIDPRAGDVQRPSARRPVLVLVVVALLGVVLIGGAILLVGRRSTPPRLPFDGVYRGEFVALPDLPRPMAYPQAVLLADGRVLVIGSAGDGSDRTVTGEIYDPATGTTDRLGPISSPRGFVDQALGLADGRVLILADGTAEVLDPATRIVLGAGPMVSPRRAPAVRLLDGRVLLAGGITPGGGEKTPLLSAELFDPGTLTFSATGAPTSSVGHMITLPDGDVFVAPDGGDTAQLYDPTAGSFRPAGTMSAAFAIASAVALTDGRIVLFGTDEGMKRRPHAEIWDPAALTSSVVADPPHQVASATLLIDGRILLMGGLDPGRDPTWAGVFDPATGVTTPVQNPSAWDPTPTRLPDGRVLLVGGLRDGNMVASADGGLQDAPSVPTVEIFQ